MKKVKNRALGLLSHSMSLVQYYWKEIDKCQTVFVMYVIKTVTSGVTRGPKWPAAMHITRTTPDKR